MLTVIEKVLIMQDFEFFKSVSSDHLAQWAAVAKVVEIEPGTILFREGDPSRLLHLVFSGEVVLERDGVKQSVVNREGLDYGSFFSESPRLYTARAAQACRLLTISLEEVHDLLTAEPEFCWAVTQELAQLGRDVELKSARQS
jgi:CRP-like cAMP-binding protein